jgi:SiaC family regulatory phosphoprotein
MEKLTSDPTSYLPLIDFSPGGYLKMEGRAIPEDANSLFNPLINFIDQLTVPSVFFDIKLEYFNTASSKKILEMLKHLDSNTKVNDIIVNWHFEEGDEDSVETAEIYEDCLKRIKFRYKEYAEVA